MFESAHQVRSWYGLPAEIMVENDLWHLVRVGRVALVHPPLVNLLLRKGQPRRQRLMLSFYHEFGHLQTLPVAAVHALWLLVKGGWRRRSFREAVIASLAWGIAHQAVWELASETYVLAKSGSDYGRIYRKFPNPLGQLIFWGGMGLTALGLSWWLVKPNK